MPQDTKQTQKTKKHILQSAKSHLATFQPESNKN